MASGRALGLLLLACVTTYASAVTVSVVQVPTRPGVTVRVGLVRPDTPVATLIGLPGGSGRAALDGYTGDPLADAYARRGVAVAYVDTPSDLPGGFPPAFRITPEHAADIQAVMRYVRGQADVPIWLGGLSNGTISVGYLAINLPDAVPFGAVLAASVIGGPYPSLLAMNLEALHRPVFILHHNEDECSPVSGVYQLLPRLTGSPAVGSAILSGGDAGQGGCADPSHHTFAGQDDETAEVTSAFIKQYNHLIAPNLDQHGLTGNWYEPATSGQGLALEVFPDLGGAGTGLLFGGWFTFDSGASGGAERERWYTLSGPMPSGATSAALTIFQNVGGNFDAGPVTNASAVGTGTFAASTCDQAALSYAFADGRTGTIPLTRLTANVECSATTVRTTNADFDLSGNWYDPATSGQGLVIEVNPVTRIAFFTWYTYAPDGQSGGVAGQRWYTGQGAFVPGARAVAVTLYQTTGGVFDQTPPTSQTTTPVGSGTLTFAGCTSASLAYAFTGGTNAGRSGSIGLQRVGPKPAGCGS